MASGTKYSAERVESENGWLQENVNLEAFWWSDFKSKICFGKGISPAFQWCNYSQDEGKGVKIACERETRSSTENTQQMAVCLGYQYYPHNHPPPTTHHPQPTTQTTTNIKLTSAFFFFLMRSWDPVNIAVLAQYWFCTVRLWHYCISNAITKPEPSHHSSNVCSFAVYL